MAEALSSFEKNYAEKEDAKLEAQLSNAYLELPI